jgi:hypothetical protein
MTPIALESEPEGELGWFCVFDSKGSRDCALACAICSFRTCQTLMGGGLMEGAGRLAVFVCSRLFAAMNPLAPCVEMPSVDR